MLIWQKLSLLFVLYSLPSCSTENTYYITPTPETPCPRDPCHTLSQYAEQDFKNFSSNTTLVFLPGDHTLNHTISFGLTAGLSDRRNTSHHHYPYHSLTLLGDPSSPPELTSRIVCIQSAGFAFSDITELHITALAFISCGHGPAVSIWSVLNSSIINCTFQNNFSWQWQDDEHSDEDGVISTLNSTLNITGCTIRNNGGYNRGILVVESSILTLTENIFQNNTAENGGALYVYTNNVLIFTYNMFQNNVAKSSEGSGGALCALENNILIFAEYMFQSNLASFIGGAIYVGRENTLILTNNTFQENVAEY